MPVLAYFYYFCEKQTSDISILVCLFPSKQRLNQSRDRHKKWNEIHSAAGHLTFVLTTIYRQ